MDIWLIGNTPPQPWWFPPHPKTWAQFGATNKLEHKAEYWVTHLARVGTSELSSCQVTRPGVGLRPWVTE